LLKKATPSNRRRRVIRIGLALLVFGLAGVLILLWLEFTHPKLLESAVSRFSPEAAKVANEARFEARRHAYNPASFAISCWDLPNLP
jgi:hypothetical protein